MRHAFIILSFLICWLSISISQSSAQLLQEGLVAYYPLNGNANDESGNGNNGLVNNLAFVEDRFSSSNSASFFGGYYNPGSLIVSNSTALQFDSAFTFATWLKLEGTGGFDSYGGYSENGAHTLFAKDHDRSGLVGMIDFQDTTLVRFYLSGVGTPAAQFVGMPRSKFEVGSWISIIYVVTRSGFLLYYNGSLLGACQETIDFSPSNSRDFSFGKFADQWTPLYGTLDEIRVYNREMSQTEILLLYGPKLGRIEGTVTTSNNGMNGVTTMLLGPNGLPVSGVPSLITSDGGRYAFKGLPVGDYQLMIVEPLGYIVDSNPKLVTVTSEQTSTVNFSLVPIVLRNNARGEGYWKHQFDVQLTGHGSAQESETDLAHYIETIHEHYTPHCNIFAGKSSFPEWQALLSPAVKSSMIDKAKGQLAAMVLNFASLKIGQYSTVTKDNKTVGDVLSYVSILLMDNESANDELAKELASKVNEQVTIASGIVPAGNILYKGGMVKSNWELDAPNSYSLFENYPNPFNPTTKIRYALPDKSTVQLSVFNTLGQQVALLVQGEQEAGYHEVQFDATNLTSGVYFYRLTAGSFIETKKLILLK